MHAVGDTEDLCTLRYST